MSFMAEVLLGEQIEDVFVDSQVMYIMLANGTQITIKGMVVVEPKLFPRVACSQHCPSQI
jgi:hypothetical protein